MKLFDLTDRVAVITGTSRGIGRELAQGFTEAGAKVVGCARTPGAAQKTASEIRDQGSDAIGVEADVTKPEACAALVQAAVDKFGRLDILVCNAGININKPAIDFSAAEFDTVISGNLRAYFLCAQAAARQFLKQRSGGVIVMNSSNASVAAFERLTPYCAAKGGVDMLVRSLAAGRTDIMMSLMRDWDFDAIISHNRYTLLNRNGIEMFELAKSRNMAVINAAPYASGILAKGAAVQPLFAYMPAEDSIVSRVKVIEALCSRYSVPVGAAALQFSMRSPLVTSTICGVSTPERVQQTIDWANWSIPDALWTNLLALPYDMDDPEAKRVYRPG